jgi:hypothetical protein
VHINQVVLDFVDFDTGEVFSTSNPIAIRQLQRMMEELNRGWVSASALLNAKCPTLKALRRVLAANPETIRTRRPVSTRTGKPDPQRLEVYAPDWFRAQARTVQVSADPLDQSDSVLDRMIEDMERRKAEERQSRAEKRQRRAAN